MNLFKQVRAFSRGRYAAHLFTNGVHGEEEMVCAQKEWDMVELLSLLSLLAVRRMRREHTRMMSKNADNEHSLEELLTLHPCFIDIFAVIYCYVLSEKMCSLYHRVFLPVKHRFLYPLGILQAVVSCFCEKIDLYASFIASSFSSEALVFSQKIHASLPTLLKEYLFSSAT